MVSTTQAAQPNWMTPLVTVTPRLEQELRADFYGQQNGTGSQGNGQRINNYGQPPNSGWSLFPPITLSSLWRRRLTRRPVAKKGDAWGWGDYPLFLAKYRFLSANRDNGDYILTGFLFR